MNVGKEGGSVDPQELEDKELSRNHMERTKVGDDINRTSILFGKRLAGACEERRT